MPASLTQRLPLVALSLDSARLSLNLALEAGHQCLRLNRLGVDAVAAAGGAAFDLLDRWLALMPGFQGMDSRPLVAGWRSDFTRSVDIAAGHHRCPLERFVARCRGELALLDTFQKDLPAQGFIQAGDPARVLLDLPGLRLHDLSLFQDHQIANFTVVFAPRAGHHSNIAERAALYFRDQGLTRMALVEQKCADQIPLFHQGRRHREDFTSQVNQYRLVLAHLKSLTGKAPHAVAVCQPGPLLMATVILNPHLARTFGSAGWPMNTEAGSGFLSDWARLAGPGAIDVLLAWFGRKASEGTIGQGRPLFDGACQVLGFYWLGLGQHLRNFKRLVADCEKGNDVEAKRQLAFYRWYNTVHHHPEGFIRDTFNHVFARNALMRGTLPIGDKIVSVADSYDAMASDRAYRRKMDPEKILQILRDCSGTQFDPEYVDAFLVLYTEGKIN